MQVRSLAALAVVASSVVLPALADTPAAVTDRFVLLPGLPGSAYTVPHHLNGKGQAVGESHEAGSDVPHAVHWTAAGHLRDLAANAQAWSLNDSGLVVGRIGSTPGYWQQGSFHRVADFGNNMAVNEDGLMGGDDDTNLALFTKHGEQLLGGLQWGFRDTAQGINRSRDEVGTSYLTQGWGIPPTLPHLHRDGQSTMQLPIPGNNGSASGINDAGVIVGSSWFVDIHDVTTWSCALRWDDLQPACLPWTGTFAGADAVNAQGDIVGWGRAADGRSHAVLWRVNVATDLNDWMPAKWREAGWVLTEATAINDDGAIAGTLVGPDGATQAWLLKAR